MKEITFNFKYCCDNEFKKLYGKFIRSLKKQYGKKRLNEFTIIAEEQCRPKMRPRTSTGYISRLSLNELKKENQSVILEQTKNICRNCSKQHSLYKNYWSNYELDIFKEMKVKVLIPNA